MAEGPILITGASGYLGRRLVRRAALQHQVLAATSKTYAQSPAGEVVYLEVTDRDQVFTAFAEHAPHTVIHAAACNPGQGSDDDMWRVNAEGSRHVAEASVTIGARLVAMSTDVVHDGTAAPYSDAAPPSPINAYGRSKAAAEEAIVEVDPNAAIVRTSLLYGLNQIDRGTAGFADLITRGQPVRLFTDVIRNPIWVETLARALVRLAETAYAGVINIAGEQAMTREEYGRALLRYWNIDDQGLIEPTLAAEVSDEISLDVRLDSRLAEELLGMSFPGVDEILSTRTDLDVE